MSIFIRHAWALVLGIAFSHAGWAWNDPKLWIYGVAIIVLEGFSRESGRKINQ